MDTPDTISYYELSKPEMIYLSSWLDDLNRLLPQLSTSAKPLTRARLTAMHKSGTRLFAALDYGTEAGNRIVGVVLLCRTELLVGTKDWIEDVVTDEAYRGRGISSRLMSMAEQASFETGAKNLNLTSNPDRGPARQMYENRGYVLRDTGVFRLSPPSTT